MAQAKKVAAVIDRGGMIDFVTSAELAQLAADGAGRAATARDLAVAGVELPDDVELQVPVAEELAVEQPAPEQPAE
jgi:hypothetical protein